MKTTVRYAAELLSRRGKNMKTVLITGASCGIGRACATEFAKNGYFTVINYNKSEKEAKSLENEIKSAGGSCAVIQADVSEKTGCEKLFSEMERLGLHCDILINNAGVSSILMLCDTEESEYDRVFNTNMKGVYLCTRAAVGHMVRKKWGRIINISSVWGVSGASCESVYSASKAAVIGFTKACSKEFIPSGICVNAIAPGVIDTKMNSCFSAEEIKELEIPAGRMGKSEEVAKLALFLAGDDASYITGQVIGIDGGFGA